MVEGKIMSKLKGQIKSKIQMSKIYDLEERTAKFGEDLIEFAKTVKRDEINSPLII